MQSILTREFAIAELQRLEAEAKAYEALIAEGERVLRRADRKRRWPRLYALEPFLRHPFLTLWCRWRLRHVKL
jgi:hypothetical protein